MAILWWAGLEIFSYHFPWWTWVCSCIFLECILLSSTFLAGKHFAKIMLSAQPKASAACKCIRKVSYHGDEFRYSQVRQGGHRVSVNFVGKILPSWKHLVQVCMQRRCSLGRRYWCSDWCQWSPGPASVSPYPCLRILVMWNLQYSSSLQDISHVLLGLETCIRAKIHESLIDENKFALLHVHWWKMIDWEVKRTNQFM